MQSRPVAGRDDMMRLALDKANTYRNEFSKNTEMLMTGAQLATERKEREEDRKLDRYKFDQALKAESGKQRGGLGGAIGAIAGAGVGLAVPGIGPKIGMQLGGLLGGSFG